jgi:membrane-associated phospholipid phosphatase
MQRFSSSIYAIMIAITLTGLSCSKDIVERTDSLPALEPVNLDANAGAWKPILLLRPDEFSIAAPIPVTSPDYRVQINEIKSLQARMNASDEAIVRYWSAGAVLRWNEIMRELVAKHNRAPVENPDGTYPFPDPANPLAYPTFPFANPPYAARAYAYASSAQYDALVAGYHYKQVHNRPAPYTVDASLQVLVPRNTLPAYPSEDGLVMGAAVEILSLMFPGDQDFIRQKAAEHKRARLLSGANVRSDIEAGEALGKSVAGKFVARARTDRAGVAAGNEAVWKALEEQTIARGEIPWISQDSPKRPPMLPLFGKVKSLMLDSLTLVSLRAGPPPSTGSAQFAAELAEVYQVSSNLSRRDIEIVHYWADGVGTYTPPGHWNDIAAGDFLAQRFSEVRWARNMALLNMALMDAAIVCWDSKYTYFNPRPSQLDARIKTATGLPNFPAYISGHSTFSAAAATFLGHVIPSRAAAYTAMAEEASKSRLLGGIHYRSDCETGLVVGKNVGSYCINRAKTDGAE